METVLREKYVQNLADLEKNQIELPEMKNDVTQINNSMGTFNTKYTMEIFSAEEGIGDLEDGSKEIIRGRLGDSVN